MRLWSINFKYLDSKGLVALWREALLAKAVLENKTRGYTNHPQLQRFKDTINPVASINNYLYFVAIEATCRGYKFDHSKFTRYPDVLNIPVTSGQLLYEFNHLKKKLSVRDPQRLTSLNLIKQPEPMPLFKFIPGEVAAWEVVNTK